MDDLSMKVLELKKLGEEQVKKEKEIRAKYHDKPKGFCVIPELLDLEQEYKKICGNH